MENKEVKVEIINGNGAGSKARNVDTMNMELSVEFSGLKKEELMQYLKDPYWVWLRIILLTIFLFVWLAMLVVAIAVIILTPKCPSRPEQQWWQQDVVYCVQVKSFFDSNQDGIGDLNGIREKLDYIKNEVKAGAISVSYLQQEANISSLFTSTYANFTSITPQLGSMSDFEQLVKAVHKKGMKIILELNPFTTTLDHAWYEAKLQDLAPYTEYYMWDNNFVELHVYWKSFMLDSPEIDRRYPVLNLTNPAVLNEINEAIKFWLGLKVDGIRIEGDSEMLKVWAGFFVTDEAYNNFTAGLVETWRGAVQGYVDTTPRTLQHSSKVLITDLATPTNGTSEPKFLQPINDNFLKINHLCKADCMKTLISDWLESLGSNSVLSNWRVSTATGNRVASRVHDPMISVINLILLTLPGSCHILYGDELAMHDYTNQDDYNDDDKDSFENRSPRTIMLWDDSLYRGFSDTEPWRTDEEPDKDKDIQTQLALGSGMSHLKVFSRLASLRTDPSLAWGTMYLAQSKDILFYVRVAEGHPCVIVVANLGDKFATVSLKKGEMASKIPVKRAVVMASTYNFDKHQADSFKDGTEISLLQAILLESGQGLVLKCLPEKMWYA